MPVVRAAGVVVLVHPNGDFDRAPKQFLLMRHGPIQTTKRKTEGSAVTPVGMRHVATDNPAIADDVVSSRNRWDLPKGHCDGDESFRETALRELHEETGIDPASVRIDPQFQFDLRYRVRSRRKKRPAEKWVRYFLAGVTKPPKIVVTEHDGFAWFDFDAFDFVAARNASDGPVIQSSTIDPLMRSVAFHYAAKGS